MNRKTLHFAKWSILNININVSVESTERFSPSVPHLVPTKCLNCIYIQNKPEIDNALKINFLCFQQKVSVLIIYVLFSVRLLYVYIHTIHLENFFFWYEKLLKVSSQSCLCYEKSQLSRFLFFLSLVRLSMHFYNQRQTQFFFSE